jgi:hypothetical protein
MSRYSQNARNLYYSYPRRIEKGISDHVVTRIGDKKWRVLPILSRTPRSRSEGWIVEAKKFPPDTSDFGKICYPGKDRVQNREIKCTCPDATATEDYGRDWTFSRAGLFYPCKHIIAVLIKEKVDFIEDTLANYNKDRNDDCSACPPGAFCGEVDDDPNYGNFPPCTRLKILFNTVHRDNFTDEIVTLNHTAYVYGPISSIFVSPFNRVVTRAYGQQYYLGYDFCNNSFVNSDTHGGGASYTFISSSYIISEGYPPSGWYD